MYSYDSKSIVIFVLYDYILNLVKISPERRTAF